MYLYGLVIAVKMHFWSVWPRIRFDAGVAQSLFRRVSRSGPTVPVAEAAASVWQVLHVGEAVCVNTVLPAAALVVEAAGGAVGDDAEGVVLDWDEAGPVVAFPEEDEGLDGVAPGSPCSTAFGGGVPIGGAMFAGWALTQVWNATGVTT